MVSGDSLNHLLGMGAKVLRPCWAVAAVCRVMRAASSRDFSVATGPAKTGRPGFRVPVGWRVADVVPPAPDYRPEPFRRSPTIHAPARSPASSASDFWSSPRISAAASFFERGMPVLGIRRELVLFPGINIKNQKTG